MMTSISQLKQDKAFEHLFTELPFPVCVIDALGSYLFENEAFRFLRLKTSHFISGASCRLSRIAIQSDFRAAIDAVTAGAGQKTFYFPGEDLKSSLWLTLKPGFNAGDVMITVLMPDLLSLDEDVLEQRLRQLFELTAMEAKCAVLLAQGSNAQAIADFRGVSLPTIRTQLKAIREKMNVKTSLAIAAKVSKLGLPFGKADRLYDVREA